MGTGTTGLTALDTAAVWAIAIAAVLGLAATVWRLTRPFRRLARLADEFIDDWRGAAARPGVPGRPGVMERLGTIEQTMGTVAHEVRPNGGASMRDAVDRVDQRTARIENDQ